MATRLNIDKISNSVINIFEDRDVDRDNPCTCMHFYVDAPSLNISDGFCYGYYDASSEMEVCIDDSFRIASITKTFVACAVLILHENGYVDIDRPIDGYLLDISSQLLSRNGYDVGGITVSQLLSHTSGIFDYADTELFSAEIKSDLNKSWCRKDLLELAMISGCKYGDPGCVYRYSDTGYILLGEIIEVLTGSSLGLALRSLINYPKLNIASTWMEVEEIESKPINRRVHQYCRDVDYYSANGSFDIFGGGGLISTARDLALFSSALFKGKLFSKKETLLKMLSPPDVKFGGPVAYEDLQQVPGVYGFGVEISRSGRAYSHSGFWGGEIVYYPDLDISLAININQHYSRELRKTILSSVEDQFYMASL